MSNRRFRPMNADSFVRPNLRFELRLLAQGYAWIAGVDEVGRGAWAGPVVAAAVILPLAERSERSARALRRRLAGVNDSKQLTARQREALFPRILEVACAVGIGRAGSGEVDRDGIVPATRAAMIRAVAALSRPPDHLLIDALRLPHSDLPQTSIIKGDARSLSVAAASIIAKVTRDRWMAGLDEQHPGYGFGRHKGYGTVLHREALHRMGVSAAHRRSFAPMVKMVGEAW